MNLLALVPMKHDSERIPNKNFRKFCGEPLFFRILNTLLAVERVTRIVIETDSPTISRMCTESFPAVSCIDRPMHLRGGDVPMTDIICSTAQKCPSDWYLQTHSTNPLLTPATINRAIDALEAKLPTQDSLVAVNRIQARVYDEDFGAINHKIGDLQRTQELKPLFEENSNLFIFTRELALARRRHGRRPILFEMSRLEALDIDEEHEFVEAEIVAKALLNR